MTGSTAVLKAFRQHGFAVHGSMMALLLGSLLLAALAPCVAHAHPSDPATSHEAMHPLMSAMSGTDHGCPHCADSETDCLSQLAEASQPALLSVWQPVLSQSTSKAGDSGHDEPLPAVAMYLALRPAYGMPATFPAVRMAALPKHPATQRFCRFIE